MEPQLKNKDRIKLLKDKYANPESDEPIIDIFKNAQIKMQSDNSRIQSFIQEKFQPYEKDMGWESGHTDFPPQDEIGPDTRSTVRKVVDKVKGVYDENVPESWKMFMPGPADIEDARYVNEQWGPEGTVGGKVLSAGFMALPFVGSRALKGPVKKTFKGFEKLRKYISKVNPRVYKERARGLYERGEMFRDEATKMGMFRGQILRNPEIQRTEKYVNNLDELKYLDSEASQQEMNSLQSLHQLRKKAKKIEQTGENLSNVYKTIGAIGTASATTYGINKLMSKKGKKKNIKNKQTNKTE